MELTALGFDNWFEQHAANLLQPGHCLARVTVVGRGAFLVRTEDAELHAELAGKLRFDTQSATDLPCVGDWVCLQRPASDGPAVIHKVLPRKTFLRRKSSGKSFAAARTIMGVKQILTISNKYTISVFIKRPSYGGPVTNVAHENLFHLRWIYSKQHVSQCYG